MSDPEADVAVILVVYKQRQNLELLYGSLSNQTYTKFRIYFVDNNSDESEIDYSKTLNEQFALDIEYIKSGSNAGFAAGNNLGAKKAMDDGSEYIFFLNNDNELERDCIKSLVSALESHPKSGAAAPLILFGEEKKSRNIIQELGEKCEFDKYKIIKNFGSRNLEDVEKELPAVTECDILSGGAVMFTQASLRKTGLWEERYFAYGDEIDIFRRLRDEGITALAVSRARLYHHHKWNKDNRQNYYFEYYLIERNKFLYFHKFGLYGSMFLMFIADLLKFPIRLAWFIKVCDIKLGVYYLRGLFAGLVNRKGKPGLGFIK